MPEPSRRNSRQTEPLNLETLMGNKPPQALDVEEAVLGAMLVEPASIDESMEELSAACPKVSQTHMEVLRRLGALGDLPEESQMSFF